jgi:hypothetical protein
VPATAVSEAGNMPDEDLAGSERVAVGTSLRRAGDPFAFNSDFGRLLKALERVISPDP